MIIFSHGIIRILIIPSVLHKVLIHWSESTLDVSFFLFYRGEGETERWEDLSHHFRAVQQQKPEQILPFWINLSHTWFAHFQLELCTVCWCNPELFTQHVIIHLLFITQQWAKIITDFFYYYKKQIKNLRIHFVQKH